MRPLARWEKTMPLALRLAPLVKLWQLHMFRLIL
jgi:hypothetical protein